MTGPGLLQFALFIATLLLLVRPLGAYMAAVFQGERTFLSPLLAPVERLIYRAAGVDPTRESDWRRYALGVLLVTAALCVTTWGLFRMCERLRGQS